MFCAQLCNTANGHGSVHGVRCGCVMYTADVSSRVLQVMKSGQTAFLLRWYALSRTRACAWSVPCSCRAQTTSCLAPSHLTREFDVHVQYPSEMHESRESRRERQRERQRERKRGSFALPYLAYVVALTTYRLEGTSSSSRPLARCRRCDYGCWCLVSRDLACCTNLLLDCCRVGRGGHTGKDQRSKDKGRCQQ